MMRVAALYNMSSPTNSPQWKEVETAARSVGVQSRLLDVRTAKDLVASRKWHCFIVIEKNLTLTSKRNPDLFR